MAGETNLDMLLATMTARMDEEVYVFVTRAQRGWPDDIHPVAMVQEPRGTTLVVSQAEAEGAGWEATFPCRKITLDVHSSLEAVGFMARISSALAEANMGVNPIAGYFHDHLFVPVGREEDARRILAQLSSDAQQKLRSTQPD